MQEDIIFIPLFYSPVHWVYNSGGQCCLPYLSPHAVTNPVCTFWRTWLAPPQIRLRWASSINVPEPGKKKEKKETSCRLRVAGTWARQIAPLVPEKGVFNKSFTPDTADNWFQSSRVKYPGAQRTGDNQKKTSKKRWFTCEITKKSDTGADR